MITFNCDIHRKPSVSLSHDFNLQLRSTVFLNNLIINSFRFFPLVFLVSSFQMTTPQKDLFCLIVTY